jgi:PAS domain S-box-containing protein
MLLPADRADFAERMAALDAGAFIRWRSRVVSTDGVTHWVDVHARPFYDVDGQQAGFSSALRVIDYEVAAENALEESRHLLAASEEKYRLLADNAGDVVTHIRDRRFVWVSPSAERLLGAPPEYWLGRDVSEVIPPDGLDDYAERLAILEAGGSVMRRVQLHSLDGATHWVHMHSRPFYDSAGHVDGFTGSLRIIDDEVSAEQAAERARAEKERADELYRESMDNSAVGMCLALADGTFLDVNQALCDFFGYDVETLMTKTWIELTADDYLEADLANVADLMAGRIDSYRMIKHYIHASGKLICGDLSVGHVRNPDGTVRALVAQIVDITAEVATRERLAMREAENRALAQRLRAEIRSAADYVASTLPGDLRGKVEISSRFLPAQELGGDSFHYRWIDDDALAVYLVDVSGHGVRPALQSMSVHNLIRLGSLPMSTLLRPERVLSRLNGLFRMDEQDGNYFTIWYGVYESSTRTLRYASAGHPPVVALTKSDDNGWQTTSLATDSVPIGLFEDSTFQSGTYTVPVGCRMVLFSDGAIELATSDGTRWSLNDFNDLVSRLAAADELSADNIVENLQNIAVDGVIDDDCSVITLDFR